MRIDAEKIIYIAAFILSIVAHEYSHGYAAYRLGDDTAKRAGRLTLNPIAHVDLMGLICMIIFKFGWAKGVPINPLNFKNRKKDTIIVSFAGITMNIIIAIISALMLKLPIYNEYILLFLFYLILVNLMLAIFNLLPFPPLDGSKILVSLLPTKIEYYFYKYEKYLYVILVILVATGTIDKIISPILNMSLRKLLYI